MSIDKAIKLVKEYYEKAQDTNKIWKGFIRNPVAWALYKAWREADKR